MERFAEQHEMSFENGTALGASYAWHGGQCCLILTDAGIVGCGIFDIATADQFGQAYAIARGSTAHPLRTPEDLLDARIVEVSQRARSYGVQLGCTGREAVELLLKAKDQAS